MKLNFLYKFSKNTQVSNFMEIRPFRAKVFRADVQKGGQVYRQT